MLTIFEHEKFTSKFGFGLFIFKLRDFIKHELLAHMYTVADQVSFKSRIN